ncbi:MAG: HvfC/BufC family peptide modification chaperone [Endozoicomonas sp.]
MRPRDNYQFRLLAAIVTGHGGREFDRRGLEAYQGNFAANAIRALSISFPVVLQLLGEKLFSDTCQLYARHSLPVAGDWAEWGGDFPEWLLSTDLGRKLPYLSGCAELDWLYHQCGRRADPQTDFASFRLLSSETASSGRLLCNPTLTLRGFDHPSVEIWNAHNVDEPARSGLLKRAGEKLASGEGESGLVWRKHWRTLVRSIDEQEQLWLSLLMSDLSIDDALAAVNNEGHCSGSFAFDRWLPDAIENHIVTGFSRT